MPHKLSPRTFPRPFGLLTVLSLLCLGSSVASGQQSVSQAQQRTQQEQHRTGQPGGFPSTAARPSYSTLLQKGLGEGRPQVLEVPRPQVALPAAPPPQPETQQSLLELGPQRETREPGQNVSFPPPPITIGLVAQSVRFCRPGKDIAGVRVAGLEKGSPAQQAGLQAESGMGWKQIVVVLLAATPAVPLMIPLLDDIEQGSGDIIVAVDGKRVKSKEDFAREMERFQAGEVAYLSVLRGEKTLLVPVHMPSRPESAGAY